MKKLIILISMVLLFFTTDLSSEEQELVDPFTNTTANTTTNTTNTAKKTDINISQYKSEMIEDLKNKDELLDITGTFYNDPEKTDLFLEAHFNTFDSPGLGGDIAIKISEPEYKEKKELYKKIREKKYILTSTTVIFTQFAQIDEYPTGGLFYKKDYNEKTNKFYKSWKKEDLWSKYRFRMAGEKRLSTLVLMDGPISIDVPKNEANDLVGLPVLGGVEKATFMGLFKIAEKSQEYMLIEPVRYMLIWRKKGKVYTNFGARIDDDKTAEETKNEKK
jgi:hypothetical protein